MVYYRSIELAAHEVGAEGEFNRLIETFEKDGILASVKKNLVGFVSDSAGVLQGERKLEPTTALYNRCMQ